MVHQAPYDLARIKADFEREGYVILDGCFDGSADTDMGELRRAAEEVTLLTRQGEWPHRRVVGKAFPPYTDISSDSWGVQHLLHPALPNHDLFARFYASSPLLDVAASLLEATPEQLQLELFNLLINPNEHRFALPWHRDDVRGDVDAEEETQRLEVPTCGVQWNAALYDDEALFLVPGTHARIRDEAERKANAAAAPSATRVGTDGDAGQASTDGSWDVDPPTTLRVSLKAGQTAFYSQRILHRASYSPAQKRATLHGCYGRGASQDTRIIAERARNVLQHGVEWMRDPAFGAQLPGRLQPMWRNLLGMASEGAGLGYSLEG